MIFRDSPAGEGGIFPGFGKKARRFFKNRLSILGLFILVMVLFSTLFAPLISPYPGDAAGAIHFDRIHQPPGRAHPFGTDEVGNDIFTRVIYGARYSLLMGVMVLVIAVVIGVPLGLIAGFWGGMTNSVIMRLADIFLAVPSITLAMAVSAILKPSLMNSMIAISFGWWPWFTRLVRAETLRIKNEQFVTAGRGVGAHKWRIAFSDILPNCFSTIIVKMSTDMGFVILTGASLGFLGLGVQPPTPEWGTMVAEGRTYLPTVWWQTTFPGLAILVTVLGVNILGDGLRDYFDVRVD
jgi:peptide/nickel transport system permease protein